MEEFNRISVPQEMDFYSIYEDGGRKYIHIFGYTYKSSSSDYVSEDNPNGTYWANMECVGFIDALEDFIANLKANPYYVDDTYCNINQYQEDFTKDEMTDTINRYFNGECADYYLPFEDITMDTPCGNFVN